MNERDIVERIVAQLNKQKYIGYTTKKEFSKLSGISMSDIDKKLFTCPLFRKRCLRKFEDGRTFYIKTQEALNYLDETLVRGG